MKVSGHICRHHINEINATWDEPLKLRIHVLSLRLMQKEDETAKPDID